MPGALSPSITATRLPACMPFSSRSIARFTWMSAAMRVPAASLGWRPIWRRWLGVWARSRWKSCGPIGRRPSRPKKPYALPVPSAIVHGIPMSISGMPVNRNRLSPCVATLSDFMRIIYLLCLILGIYLAWFAAQSIFDAAGIPIDLKAASGAGQIINYAIVLGAAYLFTTLVWRQSVIGFFL